MTSTVTISMQEYEDLKGDVKLLMAKLKEAKSAFSIHSHEPVEQYGGSLSLGGGFDPYTVESVSRVSNAERFVLNFQCLDKETSVRELILKVQQLSKSNAINGELVKEMTTKRDNLKKENQGIQSSHDEAIREAIRSRSRTEDFYATEIRKTKELEKQLTTVSNESREWERRWAELFSKKWYESKISYNTSMVVYPDFMQ